MTRLTVNVYLAGDEILKYDTNEDFRKEMYQKVVASFTKKMSEEEFIEQHLHLEKVEEKSNVRDFTFSIDVAALKTE
jgi:hypothetical protein